MIELRFHHELYDGFAVDEAAKVYAEFAACDLEDDTQSYIVRLKALPAALEQGIDERTIGAELMNYALGKTIEKSVASTATGTATGTDTDTGTVTDTATDTDTGAGGQGGRP